MKDYYCSQAALDCMRTLTPADIDDYIDIDDAPGGHVIITDGYTADYLMNRTDFKESSRMVKYDAMLTIEHFENGIPEWLEMIPGTRIYLAEWTGSEWEFTKVEGI